MNLRLSINQIFKLISTNGADKTYIIEGPMGSGKSSITKLFDTTKYHVVTVDCTQLDVGDIQIPSVDRERGVVEYVPNVLFFGDGSKPVVINLDEIGKAPRTVQNALLPILLEHRVGMRRLPAGRGRIPTRCSSRTGSSAFCTVRGALPISSRLITTGLLPSPKKSTLGTYSTTPRSRSTEGI